MLFIAAGILAALSVLFPFACRLFPPLAQGWLQTVFAPLSDVLSTLASPCPFPLAEPLLLLLAALLLFLLFRARRSACLLLSFLLAGYALMWAPAYSLPARYAVGGNVDAAALAAVCEVLTGRPQYLRRFCPARRPQRAGTGGRPACRYAHSRPCRAQARPLSRVDARALPGRPLRAMDG